MQKNIKRNKLFICNRRCRWDGSLTNRSQTLSWLIWRNISFWLLHSKHIPLLRWFVIVDKHAPSLNLQRKVTVNNSTFDWTYFIQENEWQHVCCAKIWAFKLVNKSLRRFAVDDSYRAYVRAAVDRDSVLTSHY